MKIKVQLIDAQGFIHFRVGKSKRLVKQWLAQLEEGTEINWINNRAVWISQQYIN